MLTKRLPPPNFQHQASYRQLTANLKRHFSKGASNLFKAVILLMVLIPSKATFAQQRALFPYLYQSTTNGNSVNSPFQSLDFSAFDQGFPNYPNSVPVDLIAGKNVWLDEQGNPVFYIIGSYIVDKNGKVLDQMVNFVRTHPNINDVNNEIRSNINCLIIPFPGQNPTCVTKFYIFTLSDPISGLSTNEHSLEPYYSILDLNQNVLGVHVNGKLDNFLSNNATAQKIPLPANFVGGPFNTNVPPFVDYDGFQQFNVHMNATSIPGSNDYLLVYSHITDIYFYRVSPSGIQLVGTYSKKGQQLIDTRNLPAGMYITSVVCKTGILKRDKLVINR